MTIKSWTLKDDRTGDLILWITFGDNFIMKDVFSLDKNVKIGCATDGENKIIAFALHFPKEVQECFPKPNPINKYVKNMDDVDHGENA